ncbi:tetratricopeptide repeat protein [Nannocystis pusilla]|uniref:Tetratricopeptide repeat protein n=1 Tax=Nannocystis pusilla TaxID=889268 RepID=A0A9X3J446_9BACT|nr:tetratricopeptide repeat protein [Nannocystis pusilla]MCY1013930.1 tetratricopeptide repeat protein [Nannocystis pusilla]
MSRRSATSPSAWPSRPLERAAEVCRRAVQRHPDFVAGHYNLGNILRQLDRTAAAVECYEWVIALDGGHAEARTNLGVELQKLGRLDEAAEQCARAIDLRPGLALAHYNLGNIRKQQGRLDAAVACYRRAVELDPGHAQAHNNLGVALAELGDQDGCVQHCQQALALEPGYARCWYNLGNARRAQGQLERAVECYRRAVALDPHYRETHNNLGVVFSELGEPHEALACYRKALLLQPDDAELHMNVAFMQLLLGRFEDGWNEYEWRWRSQKFAPRRYPVPVGRRARARQDPAAAFGAGPGRHPALHPLRRLGPDAGRSRGRDLSEAAVVLARGDRRDRSFRRQGRAAAARRSARPADEPPAIARYDRPAPARADPLFVHRTRASRAIRPRARRAPGPARGHRLAGQSASRRRSPAIDPLARFAALAAIPGVELVSLQWGAGAEQLARADFPITDLGDRIEDFRDLAAAMLALDLVVCCDTAPAHLAGGLGAPVWVALSVAPDWRWLRGRADTPWYPTMRLYRQSATRTWEPVFAEMAADLRALAAAGASP